VQIEHRIEIDAELTNPDYSGIVFSPEEIEAGEHRKYVGGVWDTHGKHQLEYLISQGLKPHHKLMDIGCGAFRAGRHFIDYLDAGNYYGVDANHSVMQAGYDNELTDEQRAKQPIENLRANDRFDTDFGVEFDFAIANSVFTHVSLNHIRLCMYRLDQVMKPGGAFYATYFVRKDSVPIDQIRPAKKRNKGFFTEKNNYVYYRTDLQWAARWGDWKHEYIGDWGHPANQQMVKYTKLTPAMIAAREATNKESQVQPGFLQRLARRVFR
jgi:SAM-dependent methyltransferase